MSAQGVYGPRNDGAPSGEGAEVAESPGLFFRVLGPLRVERGGKALRLGKPQTRAVLAALLQARGDVVSVDSLIDTVWGDVPPASARVALQGHVSRLRRVLGHDGGGSCAASNSVLVTEPPGYVLRLQAHQLDLAVFQHYLSDARQLLARGQPAQAAYRLRRALGLWRGVPYADIELPKVRSTADSLEELRLSALEDQLEAELSSGLSAHIVVDIKHLLNEHPYRERLWEQLMKALARSGRTAEALETYRSVWQLLDSELGIAPSAQLQELHRTILGGGVRSG